MSRYIDADALVAKFHKMGLGENSLIEKLFADGVYVVIDTFPTADVEQVRHASWHFIDANENGDFYSVCSYCQDTRLDFVSNYCPYCGAKMDGKDE